MILGPITERKKYDSGPHYGEKKIVFRLNYGGGKMNSGPGYEKKKQDSELEDFIAEFKLCFRAYAFHIPDL